MVEGSPLRIVFFGTPAFAVPTFEALIGSRHLVVAAVTQPDRPRGRGQKVSYAPVKDRAVAAGVPVIQPDSLLDPAFVATLAALGADVGVVAAYGKILTDAVLAAPRLGLINVHASILPRYRGAAPIQRAVISGERETGITIMRVVRALDAGPMLTVMRRPIGLDETSEEVEHDLSRIGADLTISTLDRLIDGHLTEVAQRESDATYARRLTKDDGLIDWAWPAERVHNVIRGLHPWPHAFTFLGDQRFILHRSTVSRGAPDAVAGTVLEASGDRLRIAAGAGVVTVLEIQAEGKRPMPAREFLAGHPIAAGAILHAPP
jgi:methionyl-tRNA formyltransferase